MHKAYKFRLYPTKEQANLINRTIGSCRYTYNHFLAERIKAYKEEQKTISYAGCCKALTQLKKKIISLILYLPYVSMRKISIA